MSKSLDIILGVKDKFSKNFSKYSKGADKAGKDTKKLGKTAEKAAVDIKGMGASLGKLSGAFFVANLASQAFSAGLRFLTDMIREGVAGFNNQEKVLRELRVNFEQLGVDVESSMNKVTAWAGEMQWAFGVADDQSEALVNLGMSMGYTVGESMDLVEIAIGLAAQYGISVEEAFKKVVKAQNGQVEGLREIIPEIGYATNAQEAWNIMLDESNQGLEKQKENTNSLEGQLKQLRMAVGDLVESLLTTFGPALTEVFKAGTIEVNVLESRMRMWWAWLKAFVWEFTSIWTNTFGSIGDHAFTFFYNMGVSVGNFSKTVLNTFVKLGEAVGNVFSAVFNWIWSGGEGGWDGMMQSIRDGWQESMEKADKFQMSAYAQYVSNPMGDPGENPYIQDYVDAQRDFNKEWEETAKSMVTSGATGPNQMAGDVVKQDARALAMQTTGDSGLGSIQGNRFLTSGRSIAKDPQLLTAENTKKTSEGIDKMNEQIGTMNSNFDTWFDSAQAQGV